MRTKKRAGTMFRRHFLVIERLKESWDEKFKPHLGISIGLRRKAIWIR